MRLVFINTKGVNMSGYNYDTFENETEISELINKFQSESINHMKRFDAWEVPEMTNPINQKREMAIANS